MTFLVCTSAVSTAEGEGLRGVLMVEITNHQSDAKDQQGEDSPAKERFTQGALFQMVWFSFSFGHSPTCRRVSRQGG